MGEILDKINNPDDIKKLSEPELEELCKEVRTFLIDKVSKTGGHLASNLGVVELTTSLFRSFNLKKDKIIYDVGHQSYVHKMYSGRKDLFDKLRKKDGLCGFPKTEESSFDAFNTGHSSTSVSAALGIARARDLFDKGGKIIAIIGDGALTGGLSYEGLNDMGRSDTDVIVILNDNDMSVFKNVGGMSKYLSRIRADKKYFDLKYRIENFLDKVPLIGGISVRIAKKVKNFIKKAVLPTTYFEELGFTYIGPVDGHNLFELNTIFDKVKNVKGPILVHIFTQKGRGYEPAEASPHKFHGISKFNVETGELLKKYKVDYSYMFGRSLIRIAKKEKRMVAISPAMPLGSGLSRFMKTFPDRFFDVGIAEGHAVTMAAGLAMGGSIPVCAIYSSFLQRAYDNIIHDVANQNLHVVFTIDRAGAVGEDGVSHQGLYDISYLYHIPNMSILAPADFAELRWMLEYAVYEHKAPIAIRYPRGSRQQPYKLNPFEYGRAEIMTYGNDITIIACGSMVAEAVLVKDELEKLNISAEIINLRTIKPLDKDTLIKSALKTKFVITMEDGSLYGGVGSVISQAFMENNIFVKYKSFGFPDELVHQGTTAEQYEMFGINYKSISNYIANNIK